jgi:hypothetical protein
MELELSFPFLLPTNDYLRCLAFDSDYTRTRSVHLDLIHSVDKKEEEQTFIIISVVISYFMRISLRD